MSNPSVGSRRGSPFSIYRAVRARSIKYAQYLEALDRFYREGLDRLETYEYNAQCSDVNAQVERRLSLFQEFSKSDIERSVRDTGFTPSELDNLAYEESVDNTLNDRTMLFKYLEGRLQSPDPLQDPEAWHSDQDRDLMTNLLYNEYMTQLFTSDHALNFQQFSEYLASLAYWRILTRARYRKEILNEIGGQHPTVQEIENFMDRGFHQRRNEFRTEFLAYMYENLSGSREAVQRILVMYGEKVREVWDRTRYQGKTPLPGENDWMLVESTNDPLESAVEMYLVSGNINRAAKANNISSRRLMARLDELGIERKQRKGRK